MKKLMMLAALTLVGTSAYAQKANVKAAEKLASSNTAEARRLIKEAQQNDETKADPYTWLVSGQIESAVFNSELMKAQLGQTADEPKMYEALTTEIPCLLQVYTLENQPDAKGKIKLKHAKKAKELLKSDFQYLRHAGYHYIDKQNYGRSADAFTAYLDVVNHPLLAEERDLKTPELDTIAWDVAFLAVAASYEGKDYDRAIAYGTRFRNQPYKQNDIYQLTSAALMAKGDTVAAIPMLQEGASLFPKDTYFIGNIVNIYVDKGQTDEAISFLLKGLEQDPNNVSFITALGGLYERKDDLVKAEEAFVRAYELDKTNADANLNLGRMYFNQGVALLGAETLDKLTKEKATAMFTKAIPYFEVVYQSDPASIYYQLANAYHQIGNDAKAEEIMKANQ